MTDTYTPNYLDSVRIDYFRDGDTAVVHADSVVFALRAYVRQCFNVDLDPGQAEAWVVDLDLGECEVQLTRHEAWPQEDGTVGEEWFTRDPNHGPTGEHKPGVIFDEFDQGVIDVAFGR